MTRHPNAPGAPWTGEETEALRRLYPSAPQEEVLRALPGRHWRAVCRKAEKMEVTRDRHFWSPAEDAVIRRHFPPAVARRGRRRLPADWKAILRELPGRTKTSVRARRVALGLHHLAPARHWTPEEDRLLRDRWQEDGQRTLLKKLPGRSWEAIYTRAHDLGMSSIPQGWAVLKSESIRLGFDRAQALRVVAWADAWAPLVEALCWWGYRVARMAGVDGVEFPDAGFDGGAVPTKAHTNSWSQVANPRTRWTLVEEGALEAAFGRWQSWETSAQAAARRGVETPTMLRWAVRRFGLPRTGGAHLRLPRAWWDDASAHVAKGGRTLSQHAARLGVTRSELERAIRRAGHAAAPAGASRLRLYLTDAQADDALAAWRARADRPGTVRALPEAARQRKAVGR